MLRKDDFAVFEALQRRYVRVKDIAADLGARQKTVSGPLKRGSPSSIMHRRRPSKLDPPEATVVRPLSRTPGIRW
jgi:hypothetical protein